MQEIRCGKCRKLLAKGRVIEIQIACPRCGAFNHQRAESPEPERPRAPDDGDRNGR